MCNRMPPGELLESHQRETYYDAFVNVKSLAEDFVFYRRQNKCRVSRRDRPNSLEIAKETTPDLVSWRRFKTPQHT